MNHEAILNTTRMLCGFPLKQTIAVCFMGALLGMPVMCALAAENEAATEKAVTEPEKNLTLDLGNGVKLDLVLIQPGTFMMGAENVSENEKPVHKVTLTKPFYLGKYEVTQEQWQAVMGDNPSQFKEGAEAGKRPVEQVSWNDINAKFLPKLAERMSKGWTPRLPTEAEWEYCCRAGTTEDYAGKLNEMGWHESNSKDMTHPVGGKKANAWGLYDMHGNVWEWCADLKTDYPSEAVTNPTGALSGSYRLGRGGSWGGDAKYCRSALRDWGTPDYRGLRLGFRLAMDVPPLK
jgi:formylglycine-generating enzyme required for sulfatase activity